jgi:sulfite reductase (NADPH) flavoprotein alpha-component|tara:strand:- start:2058 stop:2531 length:474 start_codon:yes stop_codon:yes gene_type:complete
MTEKENQIGIYFGSQTGNAEFLASDAGALATSYGFTNKVAGLDEVSVEEFTQNKFIIICTSTWGDGEQPDNAQEMYDMISEVSDDALSGTHFAILGIGDTAFELFCESAREWDELLEQKGGLRSNDRAEFDVDYEDESDDWLASTLELMKDLQEKEG